MERVSILLVDDQQLFTEGLALILKQQFPEFDYHYADNGEDALYIIRTQKISLVLLDIGMPETNGMDVAKRIINDYPETKVLIVTQYNGDAMIAHLLKLGVHGFILKSSAGTEIKQAIECVLHTDEQYVPSYVNPTLRDKDERELPRVVFNKRQAEILLLLKVGRSSVEIAERLNLKENTINSYREEMLHMTRSRNVAELISYAYKNGILG